MPVPIDNGTRRPIGHEDGYYFEPHQVGTKAREAFQLGATEVFIAEEMFFAGTAAGVTIIT